MGVIEYLSAPHRAFADIARILRSGGVAIVTVPKRLHIDLVTIAATAPVRAIARALGVASSDKLRRLRMQRDELDDAARQAGLICIGGSQYQFTPFPYPLSRLAPKLCMRLNLPFEQWHATRAALPSFFAHGYVGCYQKP
jgi:SAM-dependent methyltransferase